jgi:hypothetical protein
MSIKIRPCPKCGCESIDISASWGGAGNGEMTAYIATCKNCKFELDNLSEDGSKRSAIAHWNRLIKNSGEKKSTSFKSNPKKVVSTDAKKLGAKVVLPEYRAKIVCLCGSTKFKKAFEDANREESLKGHIVLTVAMFGHHEGLNMDGNEKQIFDELHMRKIDLADEILVLNVGGYIGESTNREIKYAKTISKPIRFIE